MFLLLGYLFTHTTITKRKAVAIYLLGAFGLLLRYIGTLTRSYTAGVIDQLFSGYSNFPSVVLAAAIFLFLWRRNWSFLIKPSRIRILRTVSGASFGIYLIHYYFLDFTVNFLTLDIRSWQWRIFGVPLVYLVSLFLVLVMKKIPLIRHLVP